MKYQQNKSSRINKMIYLIMMLGRFPLKLKKFDHVSILKGSGTV